ncbi:MAG: Rrf2 family transcriptional regulator [Deltaproteobacteria bacterium]|nr:Rrf2 family transcriptional regulator [Deltaproteobacteria bacterium]
MLFSQTGEYALRIMACLATTSPDTPVGARNLSEETGIPIHYLSKIMRRLVLAGVLTSQKGKGGGFSLARPRDQIRFAEVLEAVDAYPEAGRCAFGWGACNAAVPCPLHESWSQLSGSVRDWALSTTLADVSNGS